MAPFLQSKWAICPLGRDPRLNLDIFDRSSDMYFEKEKYKQNDGI